MHTLPTLRKIFQGVAARHEMYRMFNRHRGDPTWTAGDAAHLFAGEWFEIAEAEHDHMLDILPPLFLRGDLFALREFMTGSVTSIFFALAIDGQATLVSRLLRPLGPDFAGADEGGDHRARVAAGSRA